MKPTRSRSFLQASATAFATLLLVSPVLAQKGEPAIDLKQIRHEAQEALQSSEWKVAAASFKKIVEAAPDDAAAWQLLGYSLHAMGKLDEALKVHLKAAEFPAVAAVASYNAACVHALQGNNDKALAWLEKAAAAGFDRPEHIATDPDMDPLRQDARFAKILKKIDGNADSDGMQVYVIKNERKCARVAWFSRTGSPGQIAIDYTPVKWQGKYDELAASEKMLGVKWRLGADFWTSLDTSVPLSLGGTMVPAGYYYLTLVQNTPGEFVLGVHDAAEVKKMRIDAFHAEKVHGGIEVALTHEKSDEVAEQLSLGITVAPGSQNSGEFAIHFGGHRLSVPVKMKVGKKVTKKVVEKKKA